VVFAHAGGLSFFDPDQQWPSAAAFVCIPSSMFSSRPVSCLISVFERLSIGRASKDQSACASDRFAGARPINVLG
jgi:hypothetical protein